MANSWGEYGFGSQWLVWGGFCLCAVTSWRCRIMRLSPLSLCFFCQRLTALSITWSQQGGNHAFSLTWTLVLKKKPVQQRQTFCSVMSWHTGLGQIGAWREAPGSKSDQCRWASQAAPEICRKELSTSELKNSPQVASLTYSRKLPKWSRSHPIGSA